MSLLAALAATAAPSEIPLPAAIPADVALAFDGNSITWYGLYDQVGEAFDEHGEDAAPGLTIRSVALGGLSWTDMTARQAEAHGMWDADASHNVLVIAEDTNSVFGGRSSAQIIADTKAYIAGVLAVHPWRIVLWGNIPQGHANAGTNPEDLTRNATLLEVNDYWRDNWQAEGLAAWVDVRTPIPQFDHDGSQVSDFTDYLSGWLEQTPPWVHPSVGSFDANTGRRAIAVQIRNALLRLDWS